MLCRNSKSVSTKAGDAALVDFNCLSSDDKKYSQSFIDRINKINIPSVGNQKVDDDDLPFNIDKLPAALSDNISIKNFVAKSASISSCGGNN